MNNKQISANRQFIPVEPKHSLDLDLQQTIKIVHAEYQQIDWEDQAFLTRVLTDAVIFIEDKRGTYASR